jgi:hypothetical protein
VNLLALAAVAGAAFALNVVAGRRRAASPRFSIAWWLYIHLPVLAGVPLRQWFGLDFWTIPVLVGLSVVGQMVGGRMSRNS